MQRDVITVPRGFFRDVAMSWQIDWRTKRTAAANDDTTQVVVSEFPRWIGRPTLRLADARLQAWGALHKRARGTVHLYRLPMHHPVAFHPQDVDAQANLQGMPFATGQYFSTGMGFAFEPFWTTTQDAVIGATEITVAVPANRPAPVVDQMFSHNDWPTSVVAIDPLADGTYLLELSMPLRAAIPSLAELSLYPYGLFEAVDDLDGAAMYDRNHVADVKLNFREVLRR